MGACSSFRAALWPSTQIEDPPHDATPFVVRVVDDADDGKTLRVKAEISPKTLWNAEAVIVRLQGMKEGEEGPKSDVSLSNALNDPTRKIVGAGEKVPVSLEIPSEGITDYQVSLFWGKDAHEVISARKGEGGAPSSPPHVIVRNLSSTKVKLGCSRPPCSSKYSINGEVFNAGGSLASKITLGVGYIWQKTGAELDLSAAIPENEGRVELPDVVLAPGEGRPLNLDLDQGVPETPGGRYVPVVRVVSAQ